MEEMSLRYGLNPDQKPARIFIEDGKLPIKVLNGKLGYINTMDALNSWQLVQGLQAALHISAAASFKHVSPAGAAVGEPLSPQLIQKYFAQDIPGLQDSSLACAYVRARGTDRLSSFGDWIALSDVCDTPTALAIRQEVSDGVIAPGYQPEALEILKQKRKGGYTIVEIDPSYQPEQMEKRQLFGITLEQPRSQVAIGPELLKNIVTKNRTLPKEAERDLVIALLTLRYTQSNSVCYTYQGQTIGVGAGQQSRIHCTRIAGNKADIWRLRGHEKALHLPFIQGLGRPERDNAIDEYVSDRSDALLADGAWQRLFAHRPEKLTEAEKQAFLAEATGVSLGSDAFFPFSDNIERAHQSGVSYVAQPGGSLRDNLVTQACDQYGMVMTHTGLRLFHH